MGKWIKTDDLQICRKVKDGIYELVEFSECDNEFYLVERDKIILVNWKDSDGEWDSDAQNIIKTYYKSLDGMRTCVSPEDEEQIVAEMIYECESSLANEMPMSYEEAEEYLEMIMNGE